MLLAAQTAWDFRKELARNALAALTDMYGMVGMALPTQIVPGLVLMRQWIAGFKADKVSQHAIASSCSVNHKVVIEVTAGRPNAQNAVCHGDTYIPVAGEHRLQCPDNNLQHVAVPQGLLC